MVSIARCTSVNYQDYTREIESRSGTRCAILSHYLERECPTHNSPWECPDRLFYRATDGEIGIILRDGGTGFVTMLYCPFCGSELPSVRDAAEFAQARASVATGADPFRRIDLGTD